MQNLTDGKQFAINTLNGRYIWNRTKSQFEPLDFNKTFDRIDINDYIQNYIKTDVDICNEISKQLNEKEEYEMKNYRYPIIEKVIVNGPATIVYFDDKDRVIVKKMGVDEDDLFSAVAQAYCKKVFGSTSAFHREVLNKLVVQEPKKRNTSVSSAFVSNSTQAINVGDTIRFNTENENI